MDIMAHSPVVWVDHGNYVVGVSNAEIDFDRKTMQFEVTNDDEMRAICCGVGPKQKCGSRCPRLRRAKAIRRRSVRAMARRWCMTNAQAANWQCDDRDHVRQMVIDRDKRERSKLGLCAHSMPESWCHHNQGTTKDLIHPTPKMLGTTIRARLTIPGVNVPDNMREFGPIAWISQSGRTMYGEKGVEGKWVANHGKLERRRVRSKIAAQARHRLALPKHLHGGAIEFNVVVNEIRHEFSGKRSFEIRGVITAEPVRTKL